MGGLLIERKEGQGAQGNFALHLLPPVPPSTENREGGGGGAMGSSPPGHGGGREAGQNGEEDERVQFPYLSQAGRPVEGGLLRRAEVAAGGPGGGAAGLEGRRAVAGRLVVVEGCTRAYL